ncbi:4'-phosphopantetheinyl transferase superfamily protein [Xanthomonas campestris pv. badrii]|uniref:Enterobactin synthase component D n=1 Tax=Xanthomonas campestris pv. badrii TaxID=149696 RepID=A0A7Z2V8Z7_XANCA|nr:4'-phosphopantetheinyl transferase superfamily protein [Xanthomonas campestris]QJD67285.1 4'-phosphopantetheinyl transferase superfamily protein [Xanthomonas campestris pv. badrii]
MDSALAASLPGLHQHWHYTLPWPDGTALSVQVLAFGRDDFAIEAFTQAGIACPAAIARSVRKRQAEYFFGRLAARQAMRQQALIDPAIAVQVGTGGAREPLWPPGIIGSISHTERLAAAAVVPAQSRRGIGIDLEHLVSPEARDALLGAVVNSVELELLHAVQTSSRWTRDALLTLVFSAKESLFKASFAAVGRYFDFSAAQLVQVQPAAGRLQLRLCETLCPQLPAGELCTIGFAWVDAQTVITYRLW